MTDPAPTEVVKERRPKLRGWNRYAFANSATRREAKGLLFQELAEATRHGMPLNEALALSMRTEGERTGIGGYHDASTRARIFQAVITLLYLVFATLGAFLLLMFSSAWAADVERVARIMALKLLPLIREGHPMSAAMEMLPGDYTSEEVEIIRAGEAWNSLPDALDRLGQFQYYERELQRHWARMAYPVTLLFFALGIGLFSVIFIAPKFADIFNQLGLELPRATRWLVELGGTAAAVGSSTISLIFMVLLLIYLVRLFMVGNRVLRDMLAGSVVIATVWAGVAFFAMLASENYFAFGFIGWTIIFIVIAFLGIALATAVLSVTEKLILRVERQFSRVFGSLPLIGAPRQAERESRWLGALSLALTSGQESPEAIAAAGRICGGELRRRSDRAAGMVRQGHSIGQSVSETQILRDTWANRLRLLDGRTSYLDGLADIAEDASRQSFHTLNRSSRVAEVLSVCLLGIGAGLFAYAMYMPLFSIPLIIGTQY